MSPSLAAALARPASSIDRGRFALTALSTAIGGALLLAALHILRLPQLASGTPEESRSDLANYVTEGGLRAGVVIAALLLTVPVLALAIQALRVGSVTRDRRIASMRLAGATPRDVRTIAAAEAGAATGAGAVLAGPAYVLLWLIVGVLPPAGARMLATPDALDLVAWGALLPLGGVAGALAGAAIHGRAVVEPLGVRRRERPAAPGRVSGALLIGGILLVVGSIAALPTVARHGTGELAMLVLAIAGLLLTAFAAGPRLVLGCSRLQARRRGAEALLAARRLRADARSAGRVAGVLLICGVALGTESVLVLQQLLDSNLGSDPTFFLVGYGMAALGVLVAIAVAVATLLVGAADGLLDARRPLAALAALGVDEQTLVRVLGRELSVIAVPAIAIGAFLGGPALTGFVGIAFGGGALVLALEALLAGIIAAFVAGLLMATVARLSARALRPLIRAAIDPENLRIA